MSLHPGAQNPDPSFCDPLSPSVSLRAIAREWGRIGITGFGGPPAHISLFRRLCIHRNAWLTSEDFEDAIAVTNLLPGPASTQLAIYCAWRLRGTRGALIGGLAFILPGLIAILAMASVILAPHPPSWILGAAAGAGAAVPAVAIAAAAGLIPASWRRVAPFEAVRLRWILYVAIGAISSASAGAWVVVALLVCGIVEVAIRRVPGGSSTRLSTLSPLMLSSAAIFGGLGALGWVAVKVGALSYGGGFVIIPLMQHDAVTVHHWMTGSQFLAAVALGQITPGPVVQTVAVVGDAAAGIRGGLIAATIAFLPSFVFVISGGRSFDAIRRNSTAQSFIAGAGPAAIGAIAGASIPLARALDHAWQYALLALAGGLLWRWRNSIVITLVVCAMAGILAVVIGLPIAP